MKHFIEAIQCYSFEEKKSIIDFIYDIILKIEILVNKTFFIENNMSIELQKLKCNSNGDK